MKRKYGRAAVLAALAVCLILMAAVSITAGVNSSYVRSIKKLVRSTTTDSIGELTVSKAQNLDERLRSEQMALQTLSGSIGAHDDIFLLKSLVSEYQELHRASCMWIFDLQGNGWSTGAQSSLIPPGQTNELFAPALLGESGVSNPFIGEMGKRQVLFYTPIRREGRIAGGLYESYPAELLQSTYGGATYNDSGYSYVLGRDGSVILSSVRFSYLQIYENFRDILKEGENNPEDISIFMDALQSGKRGSATFGFEGEEQFLSFTPLEEKPGWYFVTVIPLSMVERDGRAIVTLTVRVAAVLIASVALILILAFTVIYYRNKKRREYELYIQNTYEAISQNIDTAIFIVDSQTGNVEYAFENTREILGIPAQSFYGPKNPGMGEFQRTVFELLRTERPKAKVTWERYLYNDALGRNMWLEITVLPVTLGGTVKYMFATTDNTQDRQISEELSAAVAAAEQANAAKSRFLSNMSHDIRTPMNAVVGMTKLAEIHIEDREKVRDCLHKIGLSSRHLLNLINDVLDMSKIESGKMTMSAEDFSLSGLLEGVIAIVQPQFRDKKQTFTVVTKNLRHEYLVGDTLRLNQVFLNLTSNATKFTPEKGEITFLVEELVQKHPGYACCRFRVSDTGIGIAPEFLASIFQPFERESTNKVRQTEGTGLGLAISKNIVEAMGGQLSVESTVGEGTAFTVELELPLQSGADEELESAKVLRGLHALLLNNSRDEADEIRTYLAAFGVSVDTVPRAGNEVSASSEKKSYDMVILDWELAGDGSRETIRRILGSAGYDKLVLLSASDISGGEEELFRQEFDLILHKPVFKSTLCRKLSILYSTQMEDSSEVDLQDIMIGRRFLLVEDNELNREIATELFELSGAVVESAENGQAGLEAFIHREPGYYDAVFMDIQMPVMDGYEATRQIRASNHPQARNIPIIAMSANVFAEDIRASKRAGMDAHLGKPVVMDEVCQTLREVL